MTTLRLNQEAGPYRAMFALAREAGSAQEHLNSIEAHLRRHVPEADIEPAALGRFPASLLLTPGALSSCLAAAVKPGRCHHWSSCSSRVCRVRAADHSSSSRSTRLAPQVSAVSQRSWAPSKAKEMK